MATEEIPNCGICGEPMARLARTTQLKFEAIYVCNVGKPNSRTPCDGHLFSIALKNG